MKNSQDSNLSPTTNERFTSENIIIGRHGTYLKHSIHNCWVEYIVSSIHAIHMSSDPANSFGVIDGRLIYSLKSNPKT
jgi:hypothetical protein